MQNRRPVWLLIAVVFFFAGLSVNVSASLPLQSVSEQALFGQPVTMLSQKPRLQAVIKKLSAADRVRSEIQQTKVMKILRRPLVSTGRMIYQRDLGLYWHIERPFPSTLLINSEQMLQQNGDQQLQISAVDNPVAFGFSQVFFRLLSGNFDQLLQQFELFFLTQQQASLSASQIADTKTIPWLIGLVPKDPQLLAVVKHIVLVGSDDLSRIELSDHAGDITIVEFLQRRVGGLPLDDQELSYFEF